MKLVLLMLSLRCRVAWSGPSAPFMFSMIHGMSAGDAEHTTSSNSAHGSGAFSDRAGESAIAGVLDASAVDSIVSHGFHAIEALSHAKPRSPLVLPTGPPSDWPPSDPARRATYDDLAARLAAYGPPDESVPPLGCCLKELLKCEDSVSGVAPPTVRPYTADRIKLVGPDHVTVELRTCLDDKAAAALCNAKSVIFSGDFSEWEAAASKPYTDPALKDYATVLKLVQLLHSRGLVEFTTYRYSSVGVFCVGKKDNWLRLVFDARMANLGCTSPPSTLLTTPAILSRVHIPSSEVSIHGRPCQPKIVVVDWVDYFYQFRDQTPRG